MNKKIPLIEIKNLVKRFGNFTALNGFSLDVYAGEVHALLGDNGAGKSTFLQAVLGLVDTSGELEVLGLSPNKDRHELLSRVCSITDVAVMPRWMKVGQVLDYVEGVHPRFDISKARKILSNTNIKTSSRVRTLSRGMVVQLHLSIVMAIDAELLVLDEPTLAVSYTHLTLPKTP